MKIIKPKILLSCSNKSVDISDIIYYIYQHMYIYICIGNSSNDSSIHLRRYFII